MTPKKKAKELVRKYYSFGLNNPAQSFSWYECKQCALIAVDEIIGQWEVIDVYLADGNGQLNQNLKYWYTVKKEIEKL
jgi:hypothetical protein